MDFEWDDEKDIKNTIKHGISFVVGGGVFLDPNHLVLPAKSDIRTQEKRFQAIGIVKGRLISVIFSKRDLNVRIISVHKLERRKSRGYYSQNT